MARSSKPGKAAAAVKARAIKAEKARVKARILAAKRAAKAAAIRAKIRKKSGMGGFLPESIPTWVKVTAGLGGVFLLYKFLKG